MKKIKLKKLDFKKQSVVELNVNQMYAIKAGGPTTDTNDASGDTSILTNTTSGPRTTYSINCPSRNCHQTK